MQLTTVGRTTLAALALTAFASAAHAQEWKPTKHVEIVVTATAGGVQDRLARVFQSIMEKEKMVPVTMSVVNKPDAAQLVAVAYMNTHRADPHYLTLLGSSWQNTAIINDDKTAASDVFPVLNLVSSTTNYYVAANSQIRTAGDVVERLKKDPGSVSFSMSAAPGSQNWLTMVQFAKVAGVDPRKLRVAINAGGPETFAQVMGGHADIGVGGIDGTLPLVDSGKLRVLGLATPARVPGPRTANLPTLTEQGVAAVSANWYAIVGPKGMTADQAAYWEAAFRKAANSDEAKRVFSENFWNPELVGVKDFQAFLSRKESEQRAVLNELGLIKK